MRKLLLPFALLAAISASAYQPQANPMVFGNNRLTIITPTLLRLEYAIDGKFVDEPTLFAIDRSNALDTKDIDVTDLGDNCYEIKTPAVRIWY